MDKIIIFDTTLRDGEQSPGASLNAQQKLEVAKQLASLGVDAIEAGFPVTSEGDFKAVRLVASQVKGPIICGLARCTKKDIDAAAQALKPARRKRIHVFLATSKIHMKYKLKKAEEEILRIAAGHVKYARRFTDDVEFSPEDASRTQPEFLYSVIEEVIAAGAVTVNIPDTVGYSVPFEFGRIIAGIKENVPAANRAVISVHCHNDLGLAVANSLAAVKNGAGQVECTINGIGERAGNASLEEIVMAIKVRNDMLRFRTNIDATQIYKTSRLVSKLTGIVVQPNKAIVGRNAFSHESGIHQDGILKKRTTYEIMAPQDVGFGQSRLVLGKHSGRHAFSERLKTLGFRLSEKEAHDAFEKFKSLADKKKHVYDEDIVTLIEEETKHIPKTWQLEAVHIESGTGMAPRARVTLRHHGKITTAEATGDGPVDACYKAIEKLTKIKAKIVDYGIQAVTSGKDALGEATVRIMAGKKQMTGRAAATDIIEASAKAYLNAINRLAVAG